MLVCVNLTEADLSGAEPASANVERASVKRANFLGTTLTDTMYKDASLEREVLRGTKDARYLERTNLEVADLSLMEFPGARFKRA